MWGGGEKGGRDSGMCEKERQRKEKRENGGGRKGRRCDKQLVTVEGHITSF